MNDLIKWTAKTLVSAIVWVFILSIEYQNRPLFSYANQVFVQNEVVQAIDQELSRVWKKAKNAVELTFNEMEERDRQTASY